LATWIRDSIAADVAAKRPQFPPAFGEPPALTGAVKVDVLLPFGYGQGCNTTKTWLTEQAKRIYGEEESEYANTDVEHFAPVPPHVCQCIPLVSSSHAEQPGTQGSDPTVLYVFPTSPSSATPTPSDTSSTTISNEGLCASVRDAVAEGPPELSTHHGEKPATASPAGQKTIATTTTTTTTTEIEDDEEVFSRPAVRPAVKQEDDKKDTKSKSPPEGQEGWGKSRLFAQFSLALVSIAVVLFFCYMAQRCFAPPPSRSQFQNERVQGQQIPTGPQSDDEELVGMVPSALAL